MSQALALGTTADEFLVWEREQDLRWEFDCLTPKAMTEGTESHAAIEVNILNALSPRLRGSKCRVRGSTLKVRIGARIRYPDALVTCTLSARDSDIAPEPVVIFEVLSNSTARIDRSTKLLEYRSLPSLQHYVLLEQDEALATVYTRRGDTWVVDQLTPGDDLDLPAIAANIPLDEFYRDVDLPPGLKSGIQEL